MNNIPYLYQQPENNYYLLINELKKINETLKQIEEKINQKSSINKSYLEKDDNYYIV